MFFKFICAVVTRFFFLLVSLIGVCRVVFVKKDRVYWLLTVLFLPLLVEMILTLRRRRGNDYKWISPAIFLFLISIIPSIWILELHHQKDKSADSKCNTLDSTENIRNLFSSVMNSTNSTMTLQSIPLFKLCPDDWMLALHQILLILLILGKWLLPSPGVMTRSQLSQLLLIFVGTAADILEFTSETLSDIKSSPAMVYTILAVWTWSMLQFPLHLSVIGSSLAESEPDASLFAQLRTDIWSTVEALFIQDGPFLVVRLVVMIHFRVVHQMLIFFAIKNFLVVVLNIYRLVVLIGDNKMT